MNEPLQKKISDLQRILEINSKINSVLDLDELPGLIMNAASEVMRTEAASLMLVDETTQELVFRIALGEKSAQLTEKFRLKMGEGIAGFVAQSGQSVVVNDPQNDPRFASRFDTSTGFVTRAIACVPMKAKNKILGVLQVLNPTARPLFIPEDLELFEAFADQAAIAVTTARLHAEMVRQEKTRYELQVASQIQQHLLPDLAIACPGRPLAARSVPARVVGGDLYDAVPLGENRTVLVMGDVAGKGVPAALYMVRALSDFRFLAPRMTDPALLLAELNNRLCRDTTLGLFVTLACAVVDHSLGTIEYSLAGHPAPLIRCGNGRVRTLPEAGGPPLGLSPDQAYEKNTAVVEKNSLILFYTDGASEARSHAGEEFGTMRLSETFSRGPQDTAGAVQSLFSALENFTRGAPQHDDMSLLCAKL